MKKNFIFIAAVVQAVFAVAMIANSNPSIHWWAIAPIIACVVLLILKQMKTINPNSPMG